MSNEAGTVGGAHTKPGKIDVWMIVAIVAIVLALIAGYLALTYKQQVGDWEAAASETLATLQAAGIQVQDTVASGVADYEEQISALSTQLEQTQTQAGIAESSQAETEQELANAQAALEDTQQALEATQAELDDANAMLEQLGELVLADGTYVGPVLSARTEPIPAILFQDGTAWRIAEVAPDVTITSGGQTLTLEEFSALLQSTDPAAITLANGDYQVKVNGGLVTSMRKSKAA